MLAKRVIPCLDVDHGRVVKGVRFVSLIDAGDPIAQARVYDQQNADELTFLERDSECPPEPVRRVLVDRNGVVHRRRT